MEHKNGLFYAIYNKIRSAITPLCTRAHAREDFWIVFYPMRLGPALPFSFFLTGGMQERAHTILCRPLRFLTP